MNEPLRVLLIEDSDDDAVLLQAALEEGGLAVDVTRVQTEAELQDALTRPWDVVVSDFRLPRFDGLAALRMVRAADADVPFILVSGAIGEEIAVEVMRAGAVDFVLKDHLLRLAPAVRRELKDAENRRERRRAEQERERLLDEVQRRAAELTATFDSIADGLIIFDMEGKLLYLNTTAERILEYTSEDRVLSSEARMHKIRMFNQNDIPLPYQETPPYRAIQGETVRSEVVVIHRGNRAFWLSMSAAPILLPSGARVGSVLTFTDITALHELQDRERRYLYTLAHNLRAPATLISGNLELLLELQPPDEPYRHLVEALRRGLYRMNTMIDDFYLVTRLEEGEISLHPTRVELESCLRELLQRFSLVLDTARITLDIPPDLPPVRADHDLLETILLNLLQNALKFSAPETPVRVAARRQNGEIAVSITDQGIGIAPEDLPHIFDRFYRVGRMSKAEGTGLGLYITRRLVEAHAVPSADGTATVGGRITVDSVAGKGSTFTFTLPTVS
ncbi:MAG: sensor histidine kinase [Armatimonadota bacterium]